MLLFLIEDFIFINDLFFNLIDSLSTEPLPTKDFSPIVQLPFIVTDVEIWQKLLILTSCSITDEVFIIQHFPILVFEFTTHLFRIIVPSSILAFFDT